MLIPAPTAGGTCEAMAEATVEEVFFFRPSVRGHLAAPVGVGLRGEVLPENFSSGNPERQQQTRVAVVGKQPVFADFNRVRHRHLRRFVSGRGRDEADLAHALQTAQAFVQQTALDHAAVQRQELLVAQVHLEGSGPVAGVAHQTYGLVGKRFEQVRVTNHRFPLSKPRACQLVRAKVALLGPLSSAVRSIGCNIIQPPHPPTAD